MTILKSVSFVFTVRGEFYGESSELTYTSLILCFSSGIFYFSYSHDLSSELLMICLIA